MYKELLEIIKKYDTVIIHRHTKPDGDALGAQAGLKLILQNAFPDKKIYAVGDMTQRYAFIAGSKPDVIPDKTYNGALAVILDTSARGLISDGRYALADKRVRLDHHLFAGRIAEYELIKTDFESCCGIITDFAMRCGLPVKADAASSLYAGVITDSGRFRYDSTTGDTFARAAFLLESGADISNTYRNLYTDELDSVLARAKFTQKITLAGGGVAYIYNTADEVKQSGLDEFAVSRGMVNLMSDIRGIEAFVNFTESEAGILCELRSGRYNINPVAVKYGGGGHAKASGALIKRDDVENMLEDLKSVVSEGICK